MPPPRRRKALLLALFLLFSVLFAKLAAQNPSDPLRVSVTLVQVDAVVTDRSGKQITDLTKDDFEVLEDGKAREITYFSYIRTSLPSTNAGGPGGVVGPTSPARVTRESVQRTMALVVDDLKMSFESINHSRSALKKFVDEQMQPGDLVAIVRTSGGSAALQQFTTDKQLLHAAIGRVQFSFMGRGQFGGTGAIGDPSADSGLLAELLNRRFTIGTLGTIRQVTDGMRDMPGRKSVILLSEGFAMTDKNGKPAPVSVGEVQRVAEGANDAAVVLYSIDVRGLACGDCLQAMDNVGGLDQTETSSEQQQVEVRDALSDRRQTFRDSQEGLFFLADRTGGRAQFDNNDINAGFRRVLEDQSGYYLLGFQPDDESAARLRRDGKYHRLTVKVKRPGLRVQYRKEYIGGRSEVSSTRTPAERLLTALNSPFGGTDIKVRLTPVAVQGDKGQSAIQALLHIEGDGLQFTEADASGYRTAKLRVVAVAYGDDPRSRKASEKIFTIRAKTDGLKAIEDRGLVYSVQHEVKKAGPYRMTVAVLDEGSGKIGAASRFVEIADLTKNAFSISGITMGDGDWHVEASGDDAKEREHSTAVRKFQRGKTFSYGLMVYNAPMDDKTHQPAVEIQPRLFRGAQVVWEGKPFQPVFAAGIDPRRVPAFNVLRLTENITPGEYVLELRAKDTMGKRTAVSQSIDFEVQ